jgi:hypothetical protein
MLDRNLTARLGAALPLSRMRAEARRRTFGAWTLKRSSGLPPS